MCLSTCAALAAGARAQGTSGPSYALTVWTSENGLPVGEILVTAQDLEGALWLGTTTGLLRFDGARFVSWGVRGEPALPGRGVQSLVGSRDGSLWVGFNDAGGVARVQNGRVASSANQPNAPTGTVVALLEDRQGGIWAGASDGLFRNLGGEWKAFGAADGYGGAPVYSLFEDRSGRLWAGTAAGVYRQADGRFELIDPGSNNVQSLAEDGSGTIWVTDNNRIVQRLVNRSRPQLAPEVRLPASGWRLVRDRRGQLWVAALGGGLLRIDAPEAESAAIQRIPYEHRIVGSPRSLFEDREGNLWVGMRGGGLLRLSESSISTDVPLAGLTNDGVRSLAVTPDGSVWVATGHNLNRFAGARRDVYDVPLAMTLHTDQRGVLWAATTVGLGRIVQGRFVPVSTSPDVRWGRLLSIATSLDGTIWLCGQLQGLMSLQGDRITTFDDVPAVAGKPCTATFVDRRGRVWAGFLGGGVAVHENGRFQSFAARDGVAGGRVMAIAEDRSGGVWIATSGGVTRYQMNRFVSLTSANGPFADLVPALVEDDEGYVWVVVHSGAAAMRFHPREVDKAAANPAHQIEYALYDGSDGMQGELQWISGVKGVRAGDGRLWLTTGLGVAIVDPRDLPQNLRPPPPRIETVTVDGERGGPARNVELPDGTSQLRIEYGAVSLSDASKLRFRYMLGPLEDDWVQAGNRREVTYTNPPSGVFRLRVSATTDGVWTEAAVWEFSVAPPFYRRTWFIVLVALAVAGGIAAAWWLRLRAVRGQYALVFAERARVGREIHDTLLQSLGAIGVELETIASQLDPTQEPARDSLRRLRRQVGHSLREARESIWELRHRALETRGLVESLRNLADNTTESKGVRTELAVVGRQRQCSADVDMQLFRIAQEAVNNAIRHGRARTIQIRLEYRDDRVSLRISDDGCGFVAKEHEASHAAGEHLGLLSMRERAARIRGRFAITSGPGQGTTIEATGPLLAE
jgi:signal transduction histidine kinase/ligand-binding sensor domain-containing protein